MEGKVKWFNNKKGYGFIVAEGKDIFVHYSDIESTGYKTLRNDEEVSFELIESDKGAKAVKVQRKEKPQVKKEVK